MKQAARTEFVDGPRGRLRESNGGKQDMLEKIMAGSDQYYFRSAAARGATIQCQCQWQRQWAVGED